MPTQYTALIFQHYHHEKTRKTLTASTDDAACTAAAAMIRDDQHVELFRAGGACPVFILSGKQYRSN